MRNPRRVGGWCTRIVAIGSVPLVVAACSATPTEVNHSAGTSATSSAGATKHTTTTAGAAHVGATLTLKDSSGAAYTVQLVRMIDPAQGADSFSTPDAGKRFVGAVFTITAGTTAGSGDANNDASLIGSDNQTYSPDFDSLAGCTNFDNGQFQIGAHESSTGCVAFQVPTGVTVAKVQWTPSSGLANDFGEWLVP